jgi:filamentous hemagglutinin
VADTNTSPAEAQEPPAAAQEAPQNEASTKSAQELYQALPRAFQRKTVATSEGNSPTISGYKEAPSGYEDVRPSEVLEYQEGIGHPVRRAGARDQGVQGQYFASHAERKQAVANPDATEFEVSRPMCSDCQDFYSRAAVAKGRELTVKDPEVTRVFKVDGTVEVKQLNK